MRGGAGDRRRRGRFGPALLGLAALGGALDSINYLAVAEHLPEGRGFRKYDLSAYAEQPPLYPLLLAAASLGVFEPIRVAPIRRFRARMLRRSHPFTGAVSRTAHAASAP